MASASHNWRASQNVWREQILRIYAPELCMLLMDISELGLKDQQASGVLPRFYWRPSGSFSFYLARGTAFLATVPTLMPMQYLMTWKLLTMRKSKGGLLKSLKRQSWRRNLTASSLEDPSTQRGNTHRESHQEAVRMGRIDAWTKFGICAALDTNPDTSSLTSSPYGHDERSIL